MSTSTSRPSAFALSVALIAIAALAPSVFAGDPAGACCLRDGSCAVLTVDACDAEGGWYRGDDSLCEWFECPQPRGACCFDDAPCTEQVEEVCLAAGGAYQGDEVLCLLIDCPSMGACCLSGDLCLPASPDGCAEFGGVYLGDGTTCEDSECPDGLVGSGEGDGFGRSVIVIGDVDDDGDDDFAVGAPFSDGAAPDAGQVTVHSGRTFAPLFVRSGSADGARFGWSLAAAGDVDGDGYGDLAVGAPLDRNGRGSVRVFSGHTGKRLYTWRGKKDGDRFGFAVAGGIDVDADGRDDVIVGAPYDDTAARNAGAVTVYSGRTGAPLGTLTGEHKNDVFGWSVAGARRINADPHGDFIVGAPKCDARVSNGGRVYVFSGRHLQPFYVIDGKRKGGQFGRTLAAIGRADDDGRDDFAVGSPLYDKTGAADAGRVDVYSGRDGKRLWSKTGQAGDRRGSAIACAGDVDGDGRMDVLIGAPYADAAGNAAGRITVHLGFGGATLTTIDGANAGDRLGSAATALLYVEGLDGLPLLLGGAPGSDVAGTDAGEVIVEIVE